MSASTFVIRCGPIVRRTDAGSSAIWIELDRPAALRGVAHPYHPAPRRGARGTVSEVAWTVQVGDSHYALVVFARLAAGTVYRYELQATALGPGAPRTATQFARTRWTALDLTRFGYGLGPTFRTLPAPGREELRIAFGSCRCLDGGATGEDYGPDVFEAYAEQLGLDGRDRVKTWPMLMILLGDQIYADNVAPSVVKTLRDRGRVFAKLDSLRARHDHLQRAKAADPSFDATAGEGGIQLQELGDFAELYRASWTTKDVPRLLAHIPMFMVPDDHEVTDGWSITGGWEDDAGSDEAWRRVVVHGMVACWLYEQWGNAPWSDSDPRMQAMATARARQADAYPALYDVCERWFVGQRPVNYFTIPTDPPTIVLDTRADRLHVAPITEAGVTRWADEADRIISRAQQTWFEQQLHNQRTVVIASSVPLMQAIGLDLIHLVAARPLTELGKQIERNLGGRVADGQTNADLYELMRRQHDMETISAFPRSWFDFLAALVRTRRAIWLGGDVHYSLVHAGDVTIGSQTCHLTAAISSPLRHERSAGAFKSRVEFADPSDALAKVAGATADLPAPLPGASLRLVLGPLRRQGDIAAVLDTATRLVPPLRRIGVGAGLSGDYANAASSVVRANTVGHVTVATLGVPVIQFGVASERVTSKPGPDARSRPPRVVWLSAGDAT